MRVRGSGSGLGAGEFETSRQLRRERTKDVGAVRRALKYSAVSTQSTEHHCWCSCNVGKNIKKPT